MIKYLFFSLILFITLLISTTPYVYGAQDFRFEQPAGLGLQAGIKDKAHAEPLVQTIVSNVLTIFFAVGGLGVVVYFVWGSVDWIFSGGDKEKVSNARKKMTNAIIGLALLSLSFVIINIVGEVVGFNPLNNLQLRGLGDNTPPVGNPTIPQ